MPKPPVKASSTIKPKASNTPSSDPKNLNKYFSNIKLGISKFDRRQAIIAGVGLALIAILIIAFVSAAGLRKKVDLTFGSLTGGATRNSDNSISFNSAPSPATVSYRNSNPLYTTQPGIPSAQLNLSKLLIGETVDLAWFHSNAANPPTGQNGQFRAWCSPSHISNDDAIVYPGQPGKAHEHIFYGNTDSNAFSTASSIVNSGGSTCAGQEANRTSYWFPTMIDTQGKTRIPNQMILYYKGEGVKKPAGGYSSVPQGIKMLAGNSKAVYPNIQRHGYNDGFACGDLFTNPTSDLIPGDPVISRAGSVSTDYVRAPACIGNGRAASDPAHVSLKQKVLYPRCWDGKPIDLNAPTVANDYNHVVYPSNYNDGECPAAYPYVFPEISILFEWELTSGESTTGWHLSSDHVHNADGTVTEQPGGTTRHGDYIAGWNKQIIDSWTNNCINTEWNCQTQFVSNQANAFGVGANLYAYMKNTDTGLYFNKGPVKN
ncbi:MAG: DUF1996 domain-containing protein [bacterium]